MGWLEEADRLRQNFRQRQAAISQREDQLFKSLADELNRHVEAAKTRPEFSALTVYREPDSVIIAFPADRSSSAISLPRQAAVSLDRDTHEVVADISGNDREGSRQSFRLEVDGDDAVVFTRQDASLPVSEVAIYILWPLLYPEIGPYSGPKKQHIATVNIPGL